MWVGTRSEYSARSSWRWPRRWPCPGRSRRKEGAGWLLPVAPGLIVLAQALWLRPLLDARVQQVIGGAMPPPSRVHLCYVACEAAKVALLFAIGLAAARPIQRGR